MYKETPEEMYQEIKREADYWDMQTLNDAIKLINHYRDQAQVFREALKLYSGNPENSYARKILAETEDRWSK